MCNLNIVIKNDNKTKYDFTSFMMAVTSVSYADNSDGDGIYIQSTDKIVKGKNKVNLYKYKQEIENSNFLVSHQRISTSGKTEKNTQPFMDDNLVIVHNGIISYTETDGKSDTFAVFEKLTKLFKEKIEINLDNLSREKLLIESLKEIFKEESGTWSIAVYDKIDKSLYYFKTLSTNIDFYKFKDFLYITTNSSNKDMLSILSKDAPKTYTIDEDNLYKIEIKKDKVCLFDLKEKIEAKKYAFHQSRTTDFDEKDYVHHSCSIDNKEIKNAEKNITFGETYINDFNKELYLNKKKDDLESAIKVSYIDKNGNYHDEDCDESYAGEYEDFQFERYHSYIFFLDNNKNLLKDVFDDALNIYNYNIVKGVEKDLEEDFNELELMSYEYKTPIVNNIRNIKKLIYKSGRHNDTLSRYGGYDEYEYED